MIDPGQFRKLTDGPIPFAEVSMTVEINMDEILSEDSNLSGTPATMGIKLINGVPFGTKMTVERVLAP